MTVNSIGKICANCDEFGHVMLECPNAPSLENQNREIEQRVALEVSEFESLKSKVNSAKPKSNSDAGQKFLANENVDIEIANAVQSVAPILAHLEAKLKGMRQEYCREMYLVQTIQDQRFYRRQHTLVSLQNTIKQLERQISEIQSKPRQPGAFEIDGHNAANKWREKWDQGRNATITKVQTTEAQNARNCPQTKTTQAIKKQTETAKPVKPKESTSHSQKGFSFEPYRTVNQLQNRSATITNVQTETTEAQNAKNCPLTKTSQATKNQTQTVKPSKPNASTSNVQKTFSFEPYITGNPIQNRGASKTSVQPQIETGQATKNQTEIIKPANTEQPVKPNMNPRQFEKVQKAFRFEPLRTANQVQNRNMAKTVQKEIDKTTEQIAKTFAQHASKMAQTTKQMEKTLVQNSKNNRQAQIPIKERFFGSLPRTIQVDTTVSSNETLNQSQEASKNKSQTVTSQGSIVNQQLCEKRLRQIENSLQNRKFKRKRMRTNKNELSKNTRQNEIDQAPNNQNETIVASKTVKPDELTSQLQTTFAQVLYEPNKKDRQAEIVKPKPVKAQRVKPKSKVQNESKKPVKPKKSTKQLQNALQVRRDKANENFIRQRDALYSIESRLKLLLNRRRVLTAPNVLKINLELIQSAAKERKTALMDLGFIYENSGSNFKEQYKQIYLNAGVELEDQLNEVLKDTKTPKSAEKTSNESKNQLQKTFAEAAEKSRVFRNVTKTTKKIQNETIESSVKTTNGLQKIAKTPKSAEKTSNELQKTFAEAAEKSRNFRNATKTTQTETIVSSVKTTNGLQKIAENYRQIETVHATKNQNETVVTPKTVKPNQLQNFKTHQIPNTVMAENGKIVTLMKTCQNPQTSVKASEKSGETEKVQNYKTTNVEIETITISPTKSPKSNESTEQIQKDFVQNTKNSRQTESSQHEKRLRQIEHFLEHRIFKNIMRPIQNEAVVSSNETPKNSRQNATLVKQNETGNKSNKYFFFQTHVLNPIESRLKLLLMDRQACLGDNLFLEHNLKVIRVAAEIRKNALERMDAEYQKWDQNCRAKFKKIYLNGKFELEDQLDEVLKDLKIPKSPEKKSTDSGFYHKILKDLQNIENKLEWLLYKRVELDEQSALQENYKLVENLVKERKKAVDYLFIVIRDFKMSPKERENLKKIYSEAKNGNKSELEAKICEVVNESGQYDTNTHVQSTENEIEIVNEVQKVEDSNKSQEQNSRQNASKNRENQVEALQLKQNTIEITNLVQKEVENEANSAAKKRKFEECFDVEDESENEIEIVGEVTKPKKSKKSPKKCEDPKLFKLKAVEQNINFSTFKLVQSQQRYVFIRAKIQNEGKILPKEKCTFVEMKEFPQEVNLIGNQNTFCSGVPLPNGEIYVIIEIDEKCKHLCSNQVIKHLRVKF